jgi:hypothetical protein
MTLRYSWLGLLAALAFVGVAAVLAFAGTGGGGETPATAALSALPKANVAITGAVRRRTEPKRALAVLPLPRDSYGVVFVKDGKRISVRAEPGGGRLVKRAGPRTSFGSRTVFSVVRSQGGWAGVLTPYLPNGQLGWVRLDPHRLGSFGSDWSVDVDLSSRQATLSRNGEVVRSFAVTVGAPGTETPVGRFAITDTFRGGLNPAYGCCAAALTAHQSKLPSGWIGGSRIAIHGTAEPLGLALSHGCVRAANEDVSAIVSRVPIGSPVVIHE